MHYRDFTPEHYQSMLAKQQGRCAICDNILDRGRYTHLDHDHTTGVVRALLCRGCNIALGQVKENPRTLRLAANYLEFHHVINRS